MLGQVLDKTNGHLLVKPVKKEQAKGGLNRSIVKVYLPPNDFDPLKDKEKQFNLLSGCESFDKIYERALAEKKLELDAEKSARHAKIIDEFQFFEHLYHN